MTFTVAQIRPRPQYGGVLPNRLEVKGHKKFLNPHPP